VTRGADLVVVDDLQSVRTATKWEVYLHGGAIANVDYIKSTGAGGACISFKAAVRSRPLQVWVSAAFALRFPNEHRILEDAIGSAGSKWTSFAGSNVELVTRALRSNTTKMLDSSRARSSPHPHGTSRTCILRMISSTMCAASTQKRRTCTGRDVLKAG
jgi:hypothetical protein